MSRIQNVQIDRNCSSIDCACQVMRDSCDNWSTWSVSDRFLRAELARVVDKSPHIQHFDSCRLLRLLRTAFNSIFTCFG